MHGLVYAVSVPIVLAVILHVVGKAVTLRWDRIS